jgi:hypothetical protein
MIYSPYTYQAARARASQIIAKLFITGLIPDQSMEQWENYLTATDPIEGRKQLNMKWSLVNNRNGYENDIPGLVSEIIAQCNLASIYGKDSIVIAQDEHTQRKLEIDFLVNNPTTIEPTVQVKTICFRTERIGLPREYYGGQAKTLSLVDIEQKISYFLDRETVKQIYDAKRGYFYKWDLDELATHKFDNKDAY